MIAVEIPQNKEISGGGKNGGRKGVGSAIRRGKANRGHTHEEMRARRSCLEGCRPLYNQSRDQEKKERR